MHGKCRWEGRQCDEEGLIPLLVMVVFEEAGREREASECSQEGGKEPLSKFQSFLKEERTRDRGRGLGEEGKELKGMQMSGEHE